MQQSQYLTENFVSNLNAGSELYMGLLAWFKEKSAQNDKKNDKTPTIVSPNEDVQTVFSMDYITTPCGKYQNVMVEFPKSSIWKILINNEPQRYYPGEYSEGGWSADHK